MSLAKRSVRKLVKKGLSNRNAQLSNGRPLRLETLEPRQMLSATSGNIMQGKLQTAVTSLQPGLAPQTVSIGSQSFQLDAYPAINEAASGKGPARLPGSDRRT